MATITARQLRLLVFLSTLFLASISTSLGRKNREDEDPMNNPYYFTRMDLRPRYLTNKGGLSVHAPFHLQSKLLRHVKNYRLAWFHMGPETFSLPHHRDAESIFLVCIGKGTITRVMQDQKESFEIKQGDVLRIPVGAMFYASNQGGEGLAIAQLYKTANTPGDFEEFFPANSNENTEAEESYGIFPNPQSYFNVFSKDILESAFNTTREQLEKALVKQGNSGLMVNASKDQLRALSKQSSSWRTRFPWFKDPVFNLKRPIYSNDHGEFFEVRPEDFSELRHMNASVSFANLKPGTMMLPFYNSKATYLMMVLNGAGRIEVACPHLARQKSKVMSEPEDKKEKSGDQYQKMSAEMIMGDAFVIPAGHPVSIVAINKDVGDQIYKDQNLRFVGFSINAPDNKRNFLAGQQGNVMKQMEREVKQLAFGQEMEQIIDKQKQSYFVSITRPSQQRGYEKAN